MAFRVAAAQCKKICPERLNWPGRLTGTGKSLSEVLIYSSINPQYDNRLFNDLRVQYEKITRAEHVKNMSRTCCLHKLFKCRKFKVQVQSLTIAIVFELIYSQMAMSRGQLTFINIDQKCHSLTFYQQRVSAGNCFPIYKKLGFLILS